MSIAIIEMSAEGHRPAYAVATNEESWLILVTLANIGRLYAPEVAPQNTDVQSFLEWTP